MNPVKAMFETTDQAFPDGTVAAGFQLTLTIVPGSGDVPQVDGAPPMTGYRGTCGLDEREITIQDVAPGTYVGEIALVDAGGTPLATPITDPAPIVVAVASSVTLPVPSSLTLTRP